MDLPEDLPRLKKSTLYFLAINLISGAIVFLFFSATNHLAMMEERDYYEFGEGLWFLIIAVPVVLLCGLAHLFWAVKGVLDALCYRSNEAIAAWLVTVVGWSTIYCCCFRAAQVPPSSTYPSVHIEAATSR